MTTHDEHDNDSSLKSYLDGKDGVSATYRKVAGEQPPAQLDALILKAAAGAVAKPAPQFGASRRQQYAMAASLCLGVLLTSMYYEQQVPAQATGPLIITASVDQRQVGELDSAASKAADAGAANAGLAPQASPQSTTEQIIVNERQEAEVAQRPPPATRASELVQGAFSTTELLEVQTSPVEMVIPERNGQRIEEVATLNERPATLQFFDRQAQDLWLEEIARLVSELETSASETETLRQRLAAERASFSAVYPDFDIDAALAE